MDRKLLLPVILALGAGATLIVAMENGAKVVVKNESLSPFSGRNAFAHVEYMVSLGPRSIGSDALAETREYIGGYLRDLGLEVKVDRFQAQHLNEIYEMANVIGMIPGEGEGPVIAIGGHYDTKEIPGANDGGSSAGLLLEMARALSDQSLDHTVWIIFFDGEDTGDSPDTMFYGSRHLADSLEARDELPGCLIVPDMIGDRRLRIARDGNSDGALSDRIWSKAEEIGYGRHFTDRRIMVLDDHIPFMAAGVPSCVLIDFEYGPLNSYWHTENDDLSKIDERSLKAVGDVIYSVVLDMDTGKIPIR
jgi:Zn-dependent M28 family amino/carboxypeptidase